MFSASVDATAVLALLDRLGPSVDFVAREVGRDTASRIVAEAQGRIQRATGVTASGIHWELSRDGLGYVVLAYSTTAPQDHGPVDLWLEFGTMFSYARPFFFSSALLETAAHRRRLEDRIQEWLDQVGR